MSWNYLSDWKPNVTVASLLVVVGGFVASLLPALPSDFRDAALSAAIGVAVCRLLGRSGLALVIGFAWFVFQASYFAAEQWPPEKWNEEREAIFEVRDFVTGGPDRVSMLVSPIDAAGLPRIIRLSWYRSDIRPKLGERWHWRIRLRSPSGSANPGGFDYERWLWASGIGGTGYVVSAPDMRPHEQARSGSVAGRRLTLRQRLYEQLPDDRSRAVIVALMLGSRSDFSTATRDLFARTATSHLMAISGLHVGLVGVFSLWVLRIVTAPLLLATAQALPRAFYAISALALAIAYGLLAGASLPTQRAVLMLGCGLFAWSVARRVSLVRILAVTAAVLYGWRPASLYGAPFYMSFGAVALLLLLASRDSSLAGLNRFQAIRWQWLLSCLSLPLTAALFGQLALTGPLANVVMIPYFSLLVVPALLLSLLLLPWQWASHELLDIAHALIGLALLILDGIGSSDHTVYQSAAMRAFNVLGALAAIVILLSPLRVTTRLLIGLASLVVALPFGAPAVPLGCVRAHLLDVGQGQALVLKTRSHAMLYDTGPGFASGATAADRIVLPALHSMAVRLDAIVVSHGDSDHAGGIKIMAERYPLAEILYSDQAPPYRRCEAGVEWLWDKVHFEILHPAVGQVSPTTNAGSCVMRVSAGRHMLLLTGDIGVKQERALVIQQPGKLRASIVLVPHHGSESSSSPEFVEAVGADYAWVSAGYQNRWSFPRPAVVQRYATHGALAQSTGDAGMLSATLCPDSISVDSGYRAAHPAIYRRKATAASPVQAPKTTK